MLQASNMYAKYENDPSVSDEIITFALCQHAYYAKNLKINIYAADTFFIKWTIEMYKISSGYIADINLLIYLPTVTSSVTNYISLINACPPFKELSI